MENIGSAHRNISRHKTSKVKHMNSLAGSTLDSAKGSQIKTCFYDRATHSYISVHNLCESSILIYHNSKKFSRNQGEFYD